LRYILCTLFMKIYYKCVLESLSYYAYQVIKEKNCVVFSTELDRTGTGEQHYTLAPCKPVSPLPPPVLSYRWTETGFVENTVVWSSVQFISSKLSLALLSEFYFSNLLVVANRFVPCWFRVLHLCCWSSIHVQLKDRKMFIY
jgi:hypothetical protein